MKRFQQFIKSNLWPIVIVTVLLFVIAFMASTLYQGRSANSVSSTVAPPPVTNTDIGSNDHIDTAQDLANRNSCLTASDKFYNTADNVFIANEDTSYNTYYAVDSGNCYTIIQSLVNEAGTSDKTFSYSIYNPYARKLVATCGIATFPTTQNVCHDPHEVQIVGNADYDYIMANFMR